ncbi:hypothetical protein COO60DRAFT_331685 [Scenedesmus sp. NREL 46B-D3]|nr:hypothetical protein COO60DRAFT_331685 [Scenedesmus sp. NREL 46B-D3]
MSGYVLLLAFDCHEEDLQRNPPTGAATCCCSCLCSGVARHLHHDVRLLGDGICCLGPKRSMPALLVCVCACRDVFSSDEVLTRMRATESLPHSAEPQPPVLSDCAGRQISSVVPLLLAVRGQRLYRPLQCWRVLRNGCAGRRACRCMCFMRCAAAHVWHQALLASSSMTSALFMYLLCVGAIVMGQVVIQSRAVAHLGISNSHELCHRMIVHDSGCDCSRANNLISAHWVCATLKQASCQCSNSFVCMHVVAKQAPDLQLGCMLYSPCSRPRGLTAAHGQLNR